MMLQMYCFFYYNQIIFDKNFMQKVDLFIF